MKTSELVDLIDEIRDRIARLEVKVLSGIDDPEVQAGFAAVLSELRMDCQKLAARAAELEGGGPEPEDYVGTPRR